VIVVGPFVSGFANTVCLMLMLFDFVSGPFCVFSLFYGLVV